MVRTILKTLFWLVVIVLILFWLLGGGIGKIIDNAKSFSFSFTDILNGSSTLTSFHLPFAPSMLPQIPTDGSIVSEPSTAYQSGSETSANGTPPGNPSLSPSPWAGQVALAQDAAMTQTASGQYVEIAAAPGIGVSLPLSGWSLRSALSGVRAYIPEAASLFVMGQVNAVAPASLAPGAVAVIGTGPSPVGVSFAENICTGYLGTLQPFVPALPQQCPSPQFEIPRTASNVARLGASCFDYIATLPSCTFPSNPPSNLSVACRTEIQTTLSYNGCVHAHQATSGFGLNSWRLYLAQGKPLWGGQHDVIQLLDSQDRIVNVLNY